MTDGAAGGKDRLVDRVKRFLKVDNDDTEELHNKYRETSKDREEKIKLFEEQLNIKVMQLIWENPSRDRTSFIMVKQLLFQIHSPTSSRKSPLLDSHMGISLMFLAIMVLLLLSIFLVFKVQNKAIPAKLERVCFICPLIPANIARGRP